jgi:hypothetical protein
MLDRIAIDWAWLQATLNRIIDTVNRQKPLGSSTIAVNEFPSGTLLSLTGTQAGQDSQQPAVPDTPWQTTPDGETATWHQILGFDPNTKNVVTVWVWGGSLKQPANWWETVTLVDPANNCAQSQAAILVKH